jgi:UDP-N-acetylmuramoylalanine--D-glutamate ligase
MNIVMLSSQVPLHLEGYADDTFSCPACRLMRHPFSEEKRMRLYPYRGIRVTIMGLGLFGGGVGAARFFAERGAQVTVTDKRSEQVLNSSIESLADLPVRFVLGRHDEADFTSADVVVVNPGVPDDSSFVKLAREAGVRIEREMNLLFKLTPNNPKLAITGSNGKSTTTALLGEMVRLSDARALVGGNLGRSLLCDTANLEPGAPLVLELSSFMLEGMRELQESPHIAVVTNLSPNHLDRHRTLENYYNAKKAILEFQGPDDVAVLNADDPEVANWGAYTSGRVIWFSLRGEPEGDAAFVDGHQLVVRLGGQEEVVAVRDMLRLPGRHNTANALAAAAAALACGVQPWQVAEALATFGGLPHRLEMVARTARNVAFYNDSIATTPESVICALDSFHGPITLIAGGSDKGTPFDALGEAVARKVRRLILLGVTAPRIEEAVRRAGEKLGTLPEIRRVGSLEEATSLSCLGTEPGEVVLLSPACASFDMFRNFEERGNRFRDLARALASA